MYRVDRRDFNIGDIILPNEIGYQAAPDFDNRIERILSEEKPINKETANRSGQLFIFNELSDAIRFSCIMTNSKIYAVCRLEDTICYHRGDMNWTEIMNKLIINEDALCSFAKSYWDEIKTFKPCWEILVNKMKVQSIVIANEGNRIRMKNEFISAQCNFNVENLSLFIEEIGR